MWTVAGIMPPNIPEPIRPRLYQDGLWGFTGYTKNSPPPSPSLLSQCLPALAEWGVTEEKLIRSPKGTEEEEAAVREAGKEIQTFVERRWPIKEWETAWFVNPPVRCDMRAQLALVLTRILSSQRLQSVPGLAHIHVFARYKDESEQAAWDIEHA